MKTAVVLALPVDGAGPLDDLAGLPLAVRTVLCLQKAGFERVLLVAAEGVAGRVRTDPRVTIPLERLATTEVGRALAVAASQLGEPFVVARHDVVADPSVYEALREATIGEELAVTLPGDVGQGGPLLASPSFAAALGARRIEDALPELRRDGRVRDLPSSNAAWAVRASTPDGRRRAFDALFEACRKPVDGIVARNINRHVSIFLSKRLVHTPLTPNMMSVFTFLLGVAAGWFAARGGWLNTAVAASLLQANSILDGVDGELARVRYQQSRVGQWLDTVSDDLSNVLFYAGLGLGARSLPSGSLLCICGLVAAAVQLAVMALQYRELWRIGSGDLYALSWTFDAGPPTTATGKLLVFFRNVIKKDFATLFFLGLAVFGVLSYFLPVIAVGQLCVLLATLLRGRGKPIDPPPAAGGSAT